MDSSKQRQQAGAHDIFGEEIRARADQLRRQYPRCSDDFIICSLEYDLGMRASTIRKALRYD